MTDRPPLFRRILVVCAGNLCRSPLAEALLRARLASLGQSRELGSAGLIAIPGQPADELTAALASRHGLDLSEHRSRPLWPELIRDADLVLTMERSQRRQILMLAPLSAGKVYLLGHWQAGEIPDPYMQDWPAYERAYAQIAQAVESWLPRL